MRALAAALLLALAACGPKAPVGPATDPADPHPLPAPYVGGPLLITRDSVGPLSWSAPRTRESLRALFPDSELAERYSGTGDGQALSLVVIRRNEPLLEVPIPPDGVMQSSSLGWREVRVSGGLPEGPGGEHLLDRWSLLNLKQADCKMGQDRDRFALICPSAKASNVKLVFGIPGWASDRAPSEAILAEKAFVCEFVWVYDQGPTSPPPIW